MSVDRLHPDIVKFYSDNGIFLTLREDNPFDVDYWDITLPDGSTSHWCVACQKKDQSCPIQYRIFPDLTMRSEEETLRLIKLKAFL